MITSVSSQSLRFSGRLRPPLRAYIISARFDMLFDAGNCMVWFNLSGAESLYCFIFCNCRSYCMQRYAFSAIEHAFSHILFILRGKNRKSEPKIWLFRKNSVPLQPQRAKNLVVSKKLRTFAAANRDLAQLVAHTSGGREVAGSSPVIPTRRRENRLIPSLFCCFFLSFSSLSLLFPPSSACHLDQAKRVERSHKISEGDTLAHAKRLKPQRCLDYARHDKEGVMLVMTRRGDARHDKEG